MPEPLPTWRTADMAELDRFANVRLIALDADGTLLETAAEEVSDEILRLGNSIRHFEGSVLTTIATGRALAGASRLVSVLSRDRDVPAILYNGALIAGCQSGATL